MPWRSYRATRQHPEKMRLSESPSSRAAWNCDRIITDDGTGITQPILRAQPALVSGLRSRRRRDLHSDGPASPRFAPASWSARLTRPTSRFGLFAGRTPGRQNSYRLPHRCILMQIDSRIRTMLWPSPGLLPAAAPVCAPRSHADIALPGDCRSLAAAAQAQFQVPPLMRRPDTAPNKFVFQEDEKRRLPPAILTEDTPAIPAC